MWGEGLGGGSDSGWEQKSQTVKEKARSSASSSSRTLQRELGKVHESRGGRSSPFYEVVFTVNQTTTS